MLTAASPAAGDPHHRPKENDKEGEDESEEPSASEARMGFTQL